jgi:S-formylglutathione hydrolase FrmB
MRRPLRSSLPISLMSMAAAGALTLAAMAAPADDFKAAYAKAEAASKQSVALKTQWNTTVATLRAARAAAEAGKFDEAIALAKEAEALAEASIAQARDEQGAWKDSVIR